MELVQAYAPLVKLHQAEQHPQGSPDAFRRHARLRQSNPSGVRDRGWNHRERRWEWGDPDGPDHRGPAWPSVLGQVEGLTPELDRALRPDLPHGNLPFRQVTRPRDDRNHWGRNHARGFFLELMADPPGPPPLEHAIYHDLDRFDVPGRGPMVALYYWLFYPRNYFVLETHQGDWEHLTLYFDRRRFDAGGEPAFIYYAAHEDGLLLPWSRGKDGLERVDGTHPVVYVSRYGHASFPRPPVFSGDGYEGPGWRTWERAIPALVDQTWHAYDGAWGATGLTPVTTGPLGPYLKRGGDTVRLRADGRLT